MEAIDYSRLRKRCVDSLRYTLHDLGGEVHGAPGQQYAYKQVKGARILVVAHCDTVQKKPKWQVGQNTNVPVIRCRTLDDRLGVYTVMDLLPKLGVKADVLLTEGEETGRSTAALFNTEAKYNWVAEFDRRGEDVVTYQYEWGKDLTDWFGTPSRGAFSDICKLEDLGCKAFNLGIGYDLEHSKHATMYVVEYIRQMARFVNFFEEHGGKWFPHEKRKVVTYHYTQGKGRYWYGGGWHEEPQPPIETSEEEWAAKWEMAMSEEAKKEVPKKGKKKKPKKVCGFPVKEEEGLLAAPSGKNYYHPDWVRWREREQALKGQAPWEGQPYDKVPSPDEGADEFWQDVGLQSFGIVSQTGEMLIAVPPPPEPTHQTVIEQALLDRLRRRASGHDQLLEGDEEIAVCTGCEMLVYLEECTVRSLEGQLCPSCGHVVSTLPI